jgi:hypothetical protein
MMVVMSAKNECVEYQRLQRAYDDAIILWEQERYSNVQATIEADLRPRRR